MLGIFLKVFATGLVMSNKLIVTLLSSDSWFIQSNRFIHYVLYLRCPVPSLVVAPAPHSPISLWQTYISNDQHLFLIVGY